MDYQELEYDMRGNWHEFLELELGQEIKLKRNGPCPTCGGDDRAHFREDGGRVYLFCRAGCGTHSSSYGSNSCTPPENLIMNLHGYTFPELVKRVADFLGVDASASKHQKLRKTRIEAMYEGFSKKPWHRIPYTAKNAVTGPHGEFTASGNWLIVPLHTMRAGKFVMCGLAGIGKNGETVKTGSMRGCFIMPNNSDKKVFCTDFAEACRLNKNGFEVYYSPDYRAIPEKTTHVFLRSINPEFSERALNNYPKTPDKTLRIRLSKNSDCGFSIEEAITKNGDIKFLVPKTDARDYIFIGEVYELTREELEQKVNEYWDSRL